MYTSLSHCDLFAFLTAGVRLSMKGPNKTKCTCVGQGVGWGGGGGGGGLDGWSMGEWGDMTGYEGDKEVKNET